MERVMKGEDERSCGSGLFSTCMQRLRGKVLRGIKKPYHGNVAVGDEIFSAHNAKFSEQKFRAHTICDL
jgi:hypothetical protein